MFDTDVMVNDVNSVRIGGEVRRTPRYSPKFGAITLSVLNTRREVETPIVVLLDPTIANAAAARIRLGQHLTLTAYITSRIVNGTATLVFIATDYAINNTHAVVRESGRTDSAAPNDLQPVAVS